MTLPYVNLLDEPGLTGPVSDLALHLRACDHNIFGPWRGTPTFARASEGFACDSAGARYLAAHSQSRTEYFDLDADGVFETPAWCFDGARTNIQPEGTDWAAATLTNATRTVGADTLGELSFAKIADADAVNQGNAQLPALTTLLTAAGYGVVLVWIAAPDTAAASGNGFVLWDTTANVTRGGCSATWSAGVPTFAALNSGTVLWSRKIGVTPRGKNVYEVAFKPSGTLATNNHALRVIPANTAAQTGDLYIALAHVENVNTCPLSPVANTTAGAASYLAETWSLPFDAPPQAMSVYLDHVEYGTRYTSGARVLSLGNATPGTPEFYIDVNASGVYRANHHNGTALVSAVAGTPVGAGSATPNVGQRVRLYVTLSATGVVSIQQSFDGSGYSTAVSSGANALASAWAGFSGATKWYLGHPYTNRQALRLIEAKAALGVRALTTLQAA